MRAAGRRVDDEVLTHITPAHSENINFFGSIDVHASSPARPHRLPAPPRQRHPFLTGVRPGTAHTQGVGLRQSTILPPQERRHSKRFLVPPAPPGPPPSNRAALARRPSVLFPFACGRWVAARACADDKRSGARGGLRSGEPHHRQLLSVDAGLGRERRHRLAGAAQPARAQDQPHTRAAYAKWLHAQQAGTTTPAAHAQFDTDAVLPYYAYLAATGAFLENHCSGFGTNSTPNHLLIVGGQTPTLRNPPRNQPPPVWDMPSLPGHAADHGLSWKAYTGTSAYPVAFYTQLKGSPNIVRIRPDRRRRPRAPARAEHGLARHPRTTSTRSPTSPWARTRSGRPSTPSSTAGLWDDTVFLLTWDDWGGFDDHVVTPNLEHTPDGVQLAYGPAGAAADVRRPRSRPGSTSRWNSHVSIGKTVLDLLGLPPLGVPRLDDAPSLADLVDPPPGNPRTAPVRHHHHPTHPATTDARPRTRTPPPPASTRHRWDRSSCATAPPCPHPTTNPSDNPAPHRVSRASQGVDRG